MASAFRGGCHDVRPAAALDGCVGLPNRDAEHLDRGPSKPPTTANGQPSVAGRRGCTAVRHRRPGAVPGPATVRNRQSAMMPEATAPAGSGVGELGSSVSAPPLTANAATTSALLPLTRSVLPSGVRRASTAPVPAGPAETLPSSVSVPLGLIA